MFDFLRSKPKALIVGAGPVGLFAALSLKRRGVAVRVIDEAPRPAAQSYAATLHPSSVELLEAAGVVPELLAAGRRVEQVAIYDAGERRAQLDLRKLSAKFPFALILPQSTLESALVSALEEEGVDVEYDHRLARIEPAETDVQVVIHLLARHTTGYAVSHTERGVEREHSFEVPLVIGADGHASLVANQLNMETTPAGPPRRFAVLEMDVAGPAEIRVLLHPEGTAVHCPMPAARSHWLLELTEEVPTTSQSGLDDASRDKQRVPPQPDEAAQGDPHLADLVRARIPWIKTMPQIIEQYVADFPHSLTRPHESPRVALLGDAAHLFGPESAQSLNAGLREAANLSFIYSKVVQGTAQLGALAEYQERQMNDSRSVLGMDRQPRLNSEWLQANLQRLVMCLPVSGAHREQLLQQLDTPADDVPYRQESRGGLAPQGQ